MTATVDICKPGDFGWASGCEPPASETQNVTPQGEVTTGGQPSVVGNVLASTGPLAEPFTLVAVAVALIAAGLLTIVRPGGRQAR
jgi:hypothetical protein